MMELHIFTRSGSLLRAYALGESAEVIVGRDETCDVRIQARAISREHCAIELEDGQFTIRDLGSAAGTIIDGQKIERAPVKDGMEVCVGPAVLKFFESGI